MGQIYEVTVKAGEDIKAVVTDYVLGQGWESVYITGAVGSVIGMSYTTPVRDQLPLVTASQPAEGAAEVLSLTGEVMKRERMDPVLEKIYPDKTCPLFVHVHASVGVAGSHMYGGGFHDGYAFRKLRVFLQPLDEQE